MYIDIHTKRLLSEADISIYNIIISKNTQVPNRINSIGGHPWYLRGFKIPDLIEAINENTIALGVCGIDKIRGIELKKQLEIFEKHIFMAKSLKIPLIIHCARAYNELIQIIEESNFIQPIIIHGFSRSPNFAEQLIKKDYFLSFGSDLFDRPQTRASFRVAFEANRFFLETADWEGGTIREIYKEAAKIVRKKVSEIQEISLENFELVFKKKAADLILDKI